MKVYSTSFFKNSETDFNYFNDWVKKLEYKNKRNYQRIELQTSLGKTHIWGLNSEKIELQTLVIFPGARTTSLIWDLDRGLDNLNQPLRLFLIETNGLPNFSDGKTPDIKTLDYGHWANEVLEKLGITKTFAAGASFGGLVCMKLGIVNPEKIQAAFLLNPGCLQPFSLKPQNLYYNLLPIIRPTPKNVSKFLDKAIFCKPTHQLSDFGEKMLIDYEAFAINRYKDKTQKPYYVNEQLSDVKCETYLLLGEQDLLFPFQKSIKNARNHLKLLKEIKVFEKVGHGIETYSKALNFIGEKIKTYNPENFS